jgi:hypothetical protein
MVKEVKMRRLVIIVIGLTLMLFVIQTAVLVAARIIYGNDYPNPFARYATIMPGQSMDIFTPNWCSSYEEYVVEVNMIRICHTYPDEAPVSSIRIYIRDHLIQNLTFQVKGLYIGDLVMLWGHPSIQSYYGETYYARWETGVYTVTVPIGRSSRLSYWQSVDLLSIELNQLSGASCQQTECPSAGESLGAGGDM